MTTETPDRIRKRDIAKWCFFVGGIAFTVLFLHAKDQAELVIWQSYGTKCASLIDEAESSVVGYETEHRRDVEWYEQKRGEDGKYSAMVDTATKPLVRHSLECDLETHLLNTHLLVGSSERSPSSAPICR